jgi:hypothetical protein
VRKNEAVEHGFYADIGEDCANIQPLLEYCAGLKRVVRFKHAKPGIFQEIQCTLANQRFVFNHQDYGSARFARH